MKIMFTLQTYSKNGQVNQQASVDRPVSSLLDSSGHYSGTAASIPLRFSGVFCSCAGGTLFSFKIMFIEKLKTSH